MSTKQYETMSEYIEGFEAGYSFVLTQIERHPHYSRQQLLAYLKGEKIESGPTIRPTREKDKSCD